MSTEPENPAEPTDKSAELELKAHEVPEVFDFFRENGMSIVIGVVLAAAVFLGMSAYRNYKASASQTASDLLFKAQSVDQLQQILNQYGSTPTAPLAQLALASAQFDAGQYDLAAYAFSDFQQKYPNHELVPQAELGQAQCKEASGQLNEALEAFTRFADAHSDHYLRPLAVFGQARCMEQLGRYPEAKTVFEDFIAGSPTNSQWRARADAALLYLDKDARASKMAPVTQVPVPAFTNQSPAPALALPAPVAPAAQIPAPAPSQP